MLVVAGDLTGRKLGAAVTLSATSDMIGDLGLETDSAGVTRAASPCVFCRFLGAGDDDAEADTEEVGMGE